MAYIGNQPVLQTTQFRDEFPVTASTQTAFITGGFHPSAVSVFRNGVLLSEDDYTKGSDNVTITLNNAAVSGDIVVIEGNRSLAQGVSVSESRVEHTWQSGNTYVQLNADVIPAYTDVYLNGVKLAAADYTINTVNRTVSFTSAPAVGDVIAVVHRNETSALVGLPIKDSAGNSILSESGGTVTLGDGVVMQGQFNVIPNWYLAEQQITGGNDVSSGFYDGSSTAAERRTVNIPAMQLRINATVYTLSTATTLDANTSGSWASGEASTYAPAANRVGLDFYVYAVEPSSGTTPNFCLSANSSYPNGTVGGVTASAANSRKLGGIHCLCAAVGTISGHSLTGYLAGDILPRSVWTQHTHRPESNPEGMVFVGNRLWADIYLASNTTTLESSYGGTIVDGASNPDYHWYNFAERFAEINKRLPTQAEFMALAIGSNEEVNIAGASDPVTTGGHSTYSGYHATYNPNTVPVRRMISNVGCEDCAGALWQWANETGSDGAAASWITQDRSASTTYSGGADSGSYDYTNSIGRGQGYAVPNRGLLGGNWSVGAICGSRGVFWAISPLFLSSDLGSRGVSGSL